MSRVEKIGNATLYLGDCREILPTIARPDAIVTDPPYGISYAASQPNSIKYRPIANDDGSLDAAFLLAASNNVILWGANNFTVGLPIGGWIVWDKRCSKAADRMMGSPFELAWCSKRNLFKIIRLQHGGAKNADALNGDVVNEQRWHPTQKPISLAQQCISYFQDAATIADPFMGSGTTGIACHKEQRKFIGIEIDESYFDIACRRIEAAHKQPGLFPDEKPDPVAQTIPELLL